MTTPVIANPAAEAAVVTGAPTVAQRVTSFMPVIALVALLAALTIADPDFLTQRSLTAAVRTSAPLVVLAAGATLVVLCGGIDLSIGSIMALVAIVAGLFLTWHHPWYVAFSMGMLTGLACGVVNGFFVAYLRMPSFVVTLGMLSIARSLATKKPTGARRARRWTPPRMSRPRARRVPAPAT